MDHESRWNRYLAALDAFCAREGHARVPISHVEHTPAGTVSLGAWVSYVRSRYRAGLLAEHRVARLDAVPGWQWGPLRPGPLTDEVRNARIRSMRAAGMSLQRIGDEFGLSRQRIHQVVSQRSPATR
jgi:hypothetical protein